MPYVKETCKAGKVIEVKKYFTTRYHKKGIERGAIKKVTTEEMEEINHKNAITKCRRVINTNFVEGDNYLTLTYKVEDRPDQEGAKKCLSRFIKKLRACYKKMD